MSWSIQRLIILKINDTVTAFHTSVMFLGMRKVLNSMTKMHDKHNTSGMWEKCALSAFNVTSTIFKAIHEVHFLFYGTRVFGQLLVSVISNTEGLGLIVPGIWWIHAVRCWDASKVWKVINCHFNPPTDTHIYTHTHSRTHWKNEIFFRSLRWTVIILFQMLLRPWKVIKMSVLFLSRQNISLIAQKKKKTS